jgi:hypothetical protein
MTRARRWAVPGTSTCTQINADRPLGTICPVATSATLGSARHSADAAEEIRKVAAQVFGTAFDKDSVVGEDRYRPEEFIGEVDYGLPIPHPRTWPRSIRTRCRPSPRRCWAIECGGVRLAADGSSGAPVTAAGPWRMAAYER